MRKSILISCFWILGIAAFSQSKSEVRDLGIKSTSVWNYDYSSGKEVKKAVSLKKFNEKGLVIEAVDYDKAGKLKERIEYAYNENKNVIEEKYFAQNNKLIKSYKYTYEGTLRLTKEKYTSAGKLEWKKVYTYEM